MPEGGALRVAADLRRYSAELEPDVIHAHSSWGGVWARIRPFDSPIVYQPHCYKFADVTTSLFKRFVFWAAEAALARRAAAIIALTEWERRHSVRLGARRVVVVPNAPTVRHEPVVPQIGSRGSVVVMVGRICAQKDPEFFARVAQTLRASHPRTIFRWVGDGDPQMRDELLSEGIEVSGWLDDDAALAREIAAADVYLHTARYEGFPLSVLDAARLGTPVVGRDIAAFEGSGLWTVRDAHEAASALRSCLDSPSVAAEALARTRAVESLMWASPYATTLDELYANVGGCR